MAEITAALVKAFRERTGLPLMDCKQALVEAGGIEEKAVEILRAKVKSWVRNGLTARRLLVALEFMLA